MESVKFPNNSELDNDEMFMNVPAINLTNPNDTIIPDTIYTATKEALPLFKCNKKLMLTYRSQPVMDITQQGAPAGAFGTDTIVVRDAGKDVKLPIYSYDEDDRQGDLQLRLPHLPDGTQYTTSRSMPTSPTTTTTDKRKPKLYKDMLRDSIITFDNEMGNGAHCRRRIPSLPMAMNSSEANSSGSPPSRCSSTQSARVSTSGTPAYRA